MPSPSYGLPSGADYPNLRASVFGHPHHDGQAAIEAMAALAEIDRLRAVVAGLTARIGLGGHGSEVPVTAFADAGVGDHVHTWEFADGSSMGEYRFETAGDPRELYGCGGDVEVVRKRWMLVERTSLH